MIKLVPAEVAEKFKLIPLFKVKNTLTIAMAQPKNIIALDEVRSITKMDVSIVKSGQGEIEAAISEHYGISGTLDEALKKYQPIITGKKEQIASIDEGPIIKLVDALISQAIRERASDIHIEPMLKDVRVRLRVDGVLHEETTMPLHMLSPIISRIKILSGMNIADSRLPQDGRFGIKLDNREVDFRVSTFPTSRGEKAVLRILDKTSSILTLTELGFSNDNLKKFDKIIRKPHGIILVTGPTGSGKSTTLYAALSEINSKTENIITVEDPIEYELQGVTQSQVNVKAGFTFASALRSILRQDPDIILIGEIRDLETATISIQAALTGHLVFSTLHTNDAAGALTRLIDMGVETFLIASSVEAILAQRLVRKICTQCAEEVPAPDFLKAKYPEIKKVKRGVGCKVCKGEGYKGRTAIFELLVMDDNIQKMVIDRVSAQEIKRYATSKGMRTLFDDGMEKIKNGITTIDEVKRVTELE